MSSRFPDVTTVSCFVLWCRCRLSSPSSDVAAGLRLGSLCYWCLPVSLDVSSQTPVISEFLSWFFPWQQCPLRCTGMALRVIPLQVADNFFRDPPLPWVPFFCSRRRSMARHRFPCRFFSALSGFTAVSSLGTSPCSASDFVASEVLGCVYRQDLEWILDLLTTHTHIHTHTHTHH
jgi:hypothetical protein